MPDAEKFLTPIKDKLIDSAWIGTKQFPASGSKFAYFLHKKQIT